MLMDKERLTSTGPTASPDAYASGAEGQARLPADVPCGDTIPRPALPDLENTVWRQGLTDEVIIHGRLERDALLGVYLPAFVADFSHG